MLVNVRVRWSAPAIEAPRFIRYGDRYGVRMEIPGLGPVFHTVDGWYSSDSLPVPVLGDAACRFVVHGYEEDPATDDFDAAITNFLALDEPVLRAAGPAIHEYFRDVESDVGDEEGFPSITAPDDVWKHIRFIGEVAVQRDSWREQRVYVTVECECDWEPEHGLQIVFQDGRAVTKIGPYDGHFTNASAFDRDDLEGVVYHRFG